MEGWVTEKMNLEAESTTYKEYGTLRLAKEAKSTGYKNV